jgi:hypothetical protein
MSHSASASIALLLGVFLTLPACGLSVADLRTAASQDMSCPADSLQVESRDWSVRTVTGCGRTRSYVARKGEWHLLDADPGVASGGGSMTGGQGTNLTPTTN